MFSKQQGLVRLAAGLPRSRQRVLNAPKVSCHCSSQIPSRCSANSRHFSALATWSHDFAAISLHSRALRDTSGNRQPFSASAVSEDATPEKSRPIRLSQVVAKLGKEKMSRRQAEIQIRSGNIKINGKVITSPQYDLNASARFIASTDAGGLDFDSDFDQFYAAQDKLQPTSDEADSSSSNLQVTWNDNIIVDVESVEELMDYLDEEEHKLSVASSLPKVWAVHKLKGELVSHSDPLGRPTLLERIQRGGLSKEAVGGKNVTLKPIGRLDMSTEGLLLLTNCGHYAREMELPSSQLQRTYRVRVHGRITPQKLERLRNGGTFRWQTKNHKAHHTNLAEQNIRTEEHYYGPMKVQLEAPPRGVNNALKFRSNTWIQLTCREGKNRQIRNALTSLGLTVTRLIRVSFGDYQLQSIPPGMVISVPHKPVASQIHRGNHKFDGAKKSSSRQYDRQDQSTESRKAVQWLKAW